MLAPPQNKYFMGQGSWGQNYSDQWGLQRIGFDASDQSAWRLVKQNAKPVVVAVIDTGLDWDHRNIDWDSLWHAAPVDAADGKAIGESIGWDFFAHDNKPTGTTIAAAADLAASAGEWVASARVTAAPDHVTGARA